MIGGIERPTLGKIDIFGIETIKKGLNSASSNFKLYFFTVPVRGLALSHQTKHNSDPHIQNFIENIYNVQ